MKLSWRPFKDYRIYSFSISLMKTADCSSKLHTSCLVCSFIFDFLQNPGLKNHLIMEFDYCTIYQFVLRSPLLICRISDSP